MGALAYMGTRFINTKESKAEEEYKDMIINSSAEDIVFSIVWWVCSSKFFKMDLVAFQWLGIFLGYVKDLKIKLVPGKIFGLQDKELDSLIEFKHLKVS